MVHERPKAGRRQSPADKIKGGQNRGTEKYNSREGGTPWDDFPAHKSKTSERSYLSQGGEASGARICTRRGSKTPSRHAHRPLPKRQEETEEKKNNPTEGVKKIYEGNIKTLLVDDSSIKKELVVLEEEEFRNFHLANLAGPHP